METSPLLLKLLAAYSQALSSTLSSLSLPLIIAALSDGTPTITYPTDSRTPTLTLSPTLSIPLSTIASLYSTLLLSLVSNALEEFGTIVEERGVAGGLLRLGEERRARGAGRRSGGADRRSLSTLASADAVAKRVRKTVQRLHDDATLNQALQVSGLLRGMRVAAKERLLESVSAQVTEVQRKAEAEREAIQALLVEHRTLLDTASQASMELSRVTGVVQQWNASSTKEWVDTTLPRVL